MRLGASVDFTSSTGNPTFARTGGTTSMNNHVFGSLLLVSGMTVSGGQTMFLRGRSSHTFNPSSTTNGWGFSTLVRAISGTYSLVANWGTGGGFSGSVTVTSGVFDSNGFTVLCRGQFAVTADDVSHVTATFLGRAANHSFGGNALNNGFAVNNSGSFASGTGTWTLGGTGTVLTIGVGAPANLTGKPLILVTDTSSTGKTLSLSQGSTLGIVRAADVGAGGLTISSGGVQPHTYLFDELHVTCLGGTAFTLTLPVQGTQLAANMLSLRGTAAAPLSIACGTPGNPTTLVAEKLYNIDSISPSGDVTIVLPQETQGPTPLIGRMGR